MRKIINSGNPCIFMIAREINGAFLQTMYILKTKLGKNYTFWQSTYFNTKRGINETSLQAAQFYDKT